MERQPIEVLILEDRPADAELLLIELRRAGFLPNYRVADTKEKFQQLLRPELDVILADYSLPQFNALKALEYVTEKKLDIPFIVVTGALREDQAVACIKAGASDYLLKDRLARLGPAVHQALKDRILRQEKQKTEQALQESEARFSRLAANLKDVIYRYRWMPAPGFDFISTGIQDMVGYSPEEFYRDPALITRILHPEDRNAWPFNPTKKELTIRRSMRWIHKNGSVVWIENRAAFTYDNSGNPVILEGVARDITDQKMTEAELRRRTMQLAGLVQMGQAVASTLDLEKVLSQLAVTVPFLVGAEGVSVLLREGPDRLYFAAVSGKGSKGLKGMYMPADQGVAGAVVTNKRSYLVTDDTAEVEMYRKPEQVSGFTVHSLIAVPLMNGGEVVGVLEAVHGQPKAFDDDAQKLLETAATWAANAIVNARQHATIQRQLQESQALGQISQALGSMLEYENVLQMIVDSAGRIIPQVERAVIHLYNARDDTLIPEAVAGLKPGEYSRTPMRSGSGVAGQVMQTGQTINVGDTRKDPRFLESNIRSHLKSLMVAPIQSGSNRLGTLSISSPVQDAFSEADERLLTVLGVQAALAIDRAKLFNEVRQRAHFQEELNQLTQAVLSSPALEETIPDLTQRFCDLLQTDAASILLWDEHAQKAIPTGENGLAFVMLQSIQEEADINALLDKILREARPVLTHLEIPESNSFKRGRRASPYKSVLCIPMIVGNQKIGAVCFGFTAKKELPQEEISRFEAAVSQVALAIANTRLLDTTRQALMKEQMTRQQLVQSEKLAAMGRLIASVAHELNNPLQAIQNALYLLKMEMNLPAQSHEDMDVMLAETERMAGLINRLRQAYRPVTSESFSSEDINLLVSDVLKLTATHFRHHGVQVEFLPDITLPLLPVIRDQIKQVILNIALNAVEAMPEGGQFVVRTLNQADGKGITISFSDTGVGIPPELLTSIFDPFYTTKPGGTGLGLWISYDIIQRHQGKIQVESTPGKGSLFSIWLPVLPEKGEA